MPSEPFDFKSGELQLEGRLHAGTGSVVAVVLHPHPQYGGDMDNHVVVACCDALAHEGVTSLRFNFRGAGRSEGTYDEGRGEGDDALAAMKAMRSVHPAKDLLLVGYSFGAMIAASVADDSLAGLVLVSPPTAMAPVPTFPLGLRVFAATGDRDPVSPSANVSGIESGTTKVSVFAGVDHGWLPGIDDLVTELTGFARTLMPTVG